ncbi:hypothetical protein EVAR_89448_1 [Eumeta japonica]|uniref:Uncharacterized protein n=1 Tax=Eumeta variegata TaxID=151549 RepID=A0A4C1Z5B3_EUMVA|nr:hypothetical protein EVAR_89448_1 [Eumeta japonica]
MASIKVSELALPSPAPHRIAAHALLYCFRPDLPHGFLGLSPEPRGFKAPPAKLSQSEIDDVRKNRYAFMIGVTSLVTPPIVDVGCQL